MKERKEIIKKIGVVLGIVVAIFAIINLVWFFGIKIRYMSLAKGFDKVTQTEEEKEEGINNSCYEETKDGYRYLVKGTGYLSNSGYVSVCDEEGLVYETDKNGEVIADNGGSVSLFIWPKIFSGYTYGIDIESIDEWYQIDIDKDGNYIADEDADPEYQEEIKEVLEQNREEINKLLELADEMWNIR